MQSKNKIILMFLTLFSINAIFVAPVFAEEIETTEQSTEEQQLETDAETEIEEPLATTGDIAAPAITDGWWQDVMYIVDGHSVSGFYDIDNITYYFDPLTNLLQKGQQKIGKYWYYFNSETGAMAKSEFINLTAEENPEGAKTSYYDEFGHMLYGLQTIDGNLYYLKKWDGALQRGHQKVDGYWYYFDKFSGAATRAQFRVLEVGEAGDAPKTVYFDQNGHLLYGIQKINDQIYYLKKGSGALQTGHLKVDKKWYYFDKETGAAKKSEFYTLTKADTNDGPKTVYFDQSGHMLYGIQKINDQIYYLKKGSGALQTGHLKVDKKWYYFDKETGAAKKSEFYTLTKADTNDGPKTVYFDQSGHLLYGLRKINNNYYYFKNGSGALQKNASSSENHRIYRTDNSGIVYSTVVNDVPYYAQYNSEWGNTRVGGYTIKSSGCSVMVGTSIINFVTGRQDHPQYIAFRFHDDFNSYNANGIFGTTSDVWRKVAKDYDMRFESGMNYARIQDHLRQGHLVKTSVKAGTFVDRGTHALLLMGLDNKSRTYVYDPNNKGKNGWYSLDTLWNEQSSHSDDTRDGGPFFALWR